ncbi:MAG: alpha/beta hydrolase [Sphingorhabdus sp.]
MKYAASLLLLAASISAIGHELMASSPLEKPVMAWDNLLERAKPDPNETIAYGPDPLQVVDIWLPKGKGPHAAVIMIHGGCWQTGIAERDIMNWIADDLRRSGVAVWNIEYRGVDRGGGMPQTYEDVGKAADMLISHGARFGIKTSGKQVTIGHSAGGHLALWLARRPALGKQDTLRGTAPVKIGLAISQGGLPDLRKGTMLADHPCGTEAPATMARGDFARASPPEMPLGSARELLFNNVRDRISPPEFGAAYLAQMARRGRRVDMVTTENEGHVELIAPESISWSRQRAEILKALKLKVRI